MANSTVAIDEPTTIDKRVQTYSGTVATLTVEREAMVLGDPVTFGDTNEGVARVLNANPASTDYGVVVRNPVGTTAALASFAKITDGTDTALVTAGGLLQVDGSGVTQPVSGTVTANAGTGVFDVTPASPAASDYLPVRITDATNFLDPREGVRDGVTTGTITALNGVVSAAVEGKKGVSIQLSGTWSATVVVEVSNDNSTWFGSAFYNLSDNWVSNNQISNSLLVPLYYDGMSHIRARASAFTSGTINVRILTSETSSFRTLIKDQTELLWFNPMGGYDPSFFPRAAVFKASAPSTEYGLVVRNVPSGTQTVSVSTFPDNEPFNLNQYGGTATTLGQKAMTASMPVVIASDQSAVTVTGTVTANAGSGVFDVTPASPVANDYLPVRTTDGSSFIDLREGARDSVTTGSMTAAGQTVSTALEGKSGASVLLSNTFVATVAFEVSNDNSSWRQVFVQDVSQNIAVYTTTTVGLYSFYDLGGMSHIRVRVSAFTSGQVDARFILNEGKAIQPPFSSSVGATAASSGPAAVIAGLGTTGTVTVPRVLTSSPGASAEGLVVRNLPSGTQTVSGTVTANAGTGVFDVTPSAPVATDYLPVRLTDATNFLGTTANPVITRISDGTDSVLVSAAGALIVDGSAVTQPVSGTVTVTATDLDIRNLTAANDTVVANAGTGTFTVADANLDNATLVDNAAFTDGTTRVMLAGYIFDEVAGTALTENDAAAPRIDSKRAVVSVLEDATTRGQRATVTAANALKVDGSAVTQPVSGTVTANQGTANATPWEIAGDVAHDATVAGNPVRISGTSETPEDTAPTVQVSAEGDATTFTVDRDGAQFTHPHPPRIWHTSNEYTTAQTDTSVKAAPGVGLSLYVTDIFVSANGAVTITLEEGTTVLKWRHYADAAGSGASVHYIVPIKITANTALTVTTSAAVTVFVGVNGYTAP